MDKQMQTTVTLDGTLPCFKGISGELKANANGFPQDAMIKPGEVLWGRTSGGTFLVLDWSTARVFSGPVPMENFKNAAPAMLFTILEHGDDATAYRVFRELDPRWVPPDIDETVKRTRIARVEERLASKEGLLDLIGLTSLNSDYPGSAEVGELLDEALVSEFRGLATSTPSVGKFLRALRLMDTARDFGALNVEQFVQNYGPFIAQDEFDADAREVNAMLSEFLRRWPKNKYAKELVEKRQQEVAERHAAAEQARKDREAEEKREAAAERSQCVSRCQHKCMSHIYVDKALCNAGCANYECDQNECVGACQIDCSMAAKAGQPGCVSACRRG
jgi:hypothetical protein